MRLVIASACLFLLAALPARAQFSDDLTLFGFFQGQYRYSTEEGLSSPEKVSSFSLQQLNAFLMKDFNASFGAFVNAEITNSFSTDRGWGSLSLEEAWLRYNHSSKFSVKGGLLVPTFNNLNEIKNRTPLLPYIFRPLVYESSFAALLNAEGFTPTHAFLQVNGALPVGDVRVDYAAFLGNNSTDYAAPRPDGTVVAGTDLSTQKLVGGRLGLRWKGVKAGVSSSHDQRRVEHDVLGMLNNSPAAIAQFGAMLGQPITAITPEMMAMAGMPAEVRLDEVGRTRVGADVSFYRGGLFGEAEAIFVLHSVSDAQRAELAAAGAATGGYFQDDLDMTFYYALLGYNITERVFAYGVYNRMLDKSTAALAEGFDFYGVGGGFKPIEGVVLKAQYLGGGSRENPLIDFSTNWFLAAVSVSF